MTRQARRDESLITVEARMAVEVLADYLAGRRSPHDPVGTRSGRVDHFPERFLAWAWLARVVRDEYRLDQPLSAYAYAAVEQGTNDADMMDHLRQVQGLLEEQDSQRPEAVDERLSELAEWPDDLAAMGIVVQTLIHLVRHVVIHTGCRESDVVEVLRRRVGG